MTETVHYPEGVQAQGNIKVKAVLSLTSMTAPSLAEVNDASSVDLSLFLYPNGWAPTITANKGTKPPRLASKEVLESFNRNTYGLGDLVYAWAPQAPDVDDDNKARSTLTESLVVYLVERQGLDAEDEPFAVGDWVKIHKVKLGPQVEIADPSDENNEFQIQQAAIYEVPPTGRVQLVA